MPAVQLSLWGHEEPALAGFAGGKRIALDAWSWLDYVPGFVHGHAKLFEQLERGAPWRHERRVMYEREIAVPRLIASLPLPNTVAPLLSSVGLTLAERYAAHFERVGLAFYRDGQDSVAMHRDKIERDVPTLVATLSLGEPRRFLVRPFGGGTSRTFSLGSGDLFVMGGYCQRDWEHGVPKTRAPAGPRMSIMFRHVYAASTA